ncbi:CO/COL/TOC1 [Macleaya cordata]|uniref:CO/COL/TOC1 n=1 Tax=Macleaya cordata TaxID=56857 RepID=A0A200QAU0_MACCD|nr:CO/COL/TOC1 [Macleaya cordata]
MQVRAIIWLAMRETEERLNSPHLSISSSSLQFPLPSPPGISMKRSLQRFLQKRRNRIQASCPYKG